MTLMASVILMSEHFYPTILPYPTVSSHAACSLQLSMTSHLPSSESAPEISV